MPKFDFRVHAIQRMFERSISHDDVRHVVQTGDIIQLYPDNKPYPSRLMLGWVGKRPLHIVLAEDIQTDTIIIITAYEPDPMLWESDFKTKKDKSS
ncbi:MAG TPA: DUF4258 domain-containing protein [Aggregatilineales bacterium]|nr:DUF4258 domain-containing protein [Aggregatilineales bacterium]